MQFDTTKLKKQIEDNPLAAVGVGAAAVTAITKLIDTVSASRSRHAYAKQVNHRVKNKKK